MSNKLKLYYTTTSCGVASYISLKLGEVDFDSEVVDIRSGKRTDGSDFEAINWTGSVPTLVLPDGSLLNENIATLTYANDIAVKKWGPAQGTAEYYEMLNNIGYVNGLHKSMSPMFAPGANKEELQAKINQNLEWFLKFVLKGKPFIGNVFTPADVYLAICLTWPGFMGYTIPDGAKAYQDAIFAQPGVGSVYQELNKK